VAAGEFGFLTLIRLFVRPERYGKSSFFETMPSRPTLQTASNISALSPAAIFLARLAELKSARRLFGPIFSSHGKVCTNHPVSSSRGDSPYASDLGTAVASRRRTVRTSKPPCSIGHSSTERLEQRSLREIQAQLELTPSLPRHLAQTSC